MVTPLEFKSPIFANALGAGEGEPAVPDLIIGHGTFLEDWLRYEARIDPRKAFLAPVRGNSMEDLFHDGDLVLGEQMDYIDRQGVFAVRLRDELLIKYVYNSPTEVQLISENKAFPTITVTEEDDFQVIGRIAKKIVRV